MSGHLFESRHVLSQITIVKLFFPLFFLIFEFSIAIVKSFHTRICGSEVCWNGKPLPIITLHYNDWLFLHVACMNAHLQPILSIIKQDVDGEHWHEQAVKHSGWAEQMWIIFAGNIINVPNFNFVLLFVTRI